MIYWGHGKTPWNKKKLTLKDFSNQLLETFRSFKNRKINLIGFSLGSLIALRFFISFSK
jgi:esterase/lipase